MLIVVAEFHRNKPVDYFLVAQGSCTVYLEQSNEAIFLVYEQNKVRLKNQQIAFTRAERNGFWPIPLESRFAEARPYHITLTSPLPR